MPILPPAKGTSVVGHEACRAETTNSPMMRTLDHNHILAATISELAFVQQLHVNYAETVLPMRWKDCRQSCAVPVRMWYDNQCRVAANHVAQFSNGSCRFGPGHSAMKISAIISVITRLLSPGRSCRSSARLGLGSGSSTRPAGFCTSSELNGPAAISAAGAPGLFANAGKGPRNYTTRARS